MSVRTQKEKRSWNPFLRVGEKVSEWKESRASPGFEFGTPRKMTFQGHFKVGSSKFVF